MPKPTIATAEYMQKQLRETRHIGNEFERLREIHARVQHHLLRTFAPNVETKTIRKIARHAQAVEEFNNRVQRMEATVQEASDIQRKHRALITAVQPHLSTEDGKTLKDHRKVMEYVQRQLPAADESSQWVLMTIMAQVSAETLNTTIRGIVAEENQKKIRDEIMHAVRYLAAYRTRN